MTDWFEWNGKKCTDFGIHVSEHPPITLPVERNTPGCSTGFLLRRFYAGPRTVASP